MPKQDPNVDNIRVRHIDCQTQTAISTISGQCSSTLAVAFDWKVA